MGYEVILQCSHANFLTFSSFLFGTQTGKEKIDIYRMGEAYTVAGKYILHNYWIGQLWVTMICIWVSVHLIG